MSLQLVETKIAMEQRVRLDELVSLVTPLETTLRELIRPSSRARGDSLSTRRYIKPTTTLIQRSDKPRHEYQILTLPGGRTEASLQITTEDKSRIAVTLSNGSPDFVYVKYFPPHKNSMATTTVAFKRGSDHRLTFDPIQSEIHDIEDLRAIQPAIRNITSTFAK